MLRIRVLFVTTDLTTGGAEVMLYRLLMRLDRSRFEPIVLSLLDGGEWQERVEALGVKVYSLGMRRSMPTPGMVWRLVRMVRRIRPDLIQGWMYHGNVAASLARLSLGYQPPVTWCIQNTTELKYEKPLTAALIRAGVWLSQGVSRIVYVSHGAQRQHEAMGYRSDIGCAIANGCETARFVPDAEARSAVRESLGIGEEQPLIGLLARFHPMKDQATFLTAAAHLLKVQPAAHFLMAGSEVTPENAVLMAQVQALGLGDRVHLLGIRTDTPRLIAALDVFSLSSAYGEALPLVLGEAMACGVPCVATDVGDSARVIGDTGRIVPPQDGPALAAAWQEILSLDGAARSQLGQAGRSRVMELFDIEAVVNQYEVLYHQALTGEAFDPGAMGIDCAV